MMKVGLFINKIVLGVSSECILAQNLGEINWFVLHILLIKFSSVKKIPAPPPQHVHAKLPKCTCAHTHLHMHRHKLLCMFPAKIEISI